MLEVGTQVKFFNAKHAVDRMKPRIATITDANPDGTYDVVYLLCTEEAAQDPGGANVARAKRCRLYDKPKVQGNRRGDHDQWDWTVTGERFICLTVPEIIPTERKPKAIATPPRPQREFDDGSKPKPAPVAPPAPEPSPDPEEPDEPQEATDAAPETVPSEPERARPPRPSRTNSTLRVNRKPDAPAEY